ncbi:MAG: DUF452 family protein [Rikenellaceae bacterium]
MQIDWIKRDAANRSLLVVAQGWGSSVEVISNQLWPLGFDVVSLCDYRTLDSSALDFSGYSYRVLVAWSFGVWASERLFPSDFFDRAVAVAGTPCPIDRFYGIDPRVFQLTLRGVLDEGVVRFVARMCGRYLRDYLRCHSTRDLGEIREELVVLGRLGSAPSSSALAWTRAVIPLQDKIFSVASMRRYWGERGVPVLELADVPHYPFYDKEFILCITRD